VQVASEAKASPIITAFTTMSALSNMPQGERLRGSSAASDAASATSGGMPNAAHAVMQMLRTSQRCDMVASRPRFASARLRRETVRQCVETRQLIAAQSARLVAADEHLEHDAAVA